MKYVLKLIRFVLALSICSVFFSHGRLQAQSTSFWFDAAPACHCLTPAAETFISIRVSDFDSISSLSLSFQYKSDALQFNGVNYTNPSLQFPTFSVVPQAGYSLFRIAAFSTLECMTVPDNEPLFILKFKVLCDTTQLIWQKPLSVYNLYSVCDLDSLIVTPDTTGFYDGMILPVSVNIQTQPADRFGIINLPVNFTVAATASASTLNYQWMVSTDSGVSWTDVSDNNIYSGATDDTLQVTPANYSMDLTQYRCTITGCDQTVYSDAASLHIIGCTNISGRVQYANASHTPLGGATVFLWKSDTLLAQTNSDVAGNYQFPCQDTGNYKITTYYTGIWGGGNASDALLILKHFVGMSTLSGLALKAADADMNNVVNSMDALMVIKRFVGMISSFPAGDWLSDDLIFTISGPSAGIHDLDMICTGDTDTSYIP